MKYRNKVTAFILIIISFAMFGCEKKQTPKIALKEFLPLDDNATKYIYKTITINISPYDGEMKSKDIYSEKIVTGKKENCVYIDNYTLFDKQDISQMPISMKQYIKDNKIKGISEQLCVDNEKIFFYDSSDSFTLYQHNGDWTVDIQFVSASGQERTIQSECSFISLSKKIILGQERRVIHTQCEYETHKGVKDKSDWFLAEELGLYEVVMTMDDKNTNSHSIIRTSLSQYE